VTAAGALARAGAIVSVAFLASRALGWLRVSVTTAIFDASPELDAFYAAFRIPDLVYQLVAAGALGSAMVPVVAALLSNGEESRAWRVVSTVANLLLIALTGLAIGAAVFAPVIVPAITPGFDAVGTELTVRLTRIMLLGPIFLGIGSVATAALNGAGRFTAAAIAPVTYNLTIIAAAILLGPIIGVTALAFGVVAGSLAHLLVQLPALSRRVGFRYEPVIHREDPQAGQVFRLMGPRAIGLGAVQVTFIVNTTLASTLGTGAITVLNVAFTTLQLPLGLIAQPLGVVLLPAMSRAIATGERLEFGVLVDRSLRLLAYAMMFVAVVSIVLRREIVTLLFGYGRFDQEAIALTSDTLLVFLFGLPAHAAIAVMARAFYAGQDTRTPVAAAVMAVAINVAVSLVTVGSLGLSGLALGIALGAWAEAILLLALLDRHIPTLSASRQAVAWISFAASAGIAGAVCWGAMSLLQGLTGSAIPKPILLVEVGLASLAAIAAYLALSWLLRFAELPMLLRVASGAVRRRAA
jgi:putative peptidoglycan lipid II flippase